MKPSRKLLMSLLALYANSLVKAIVSPDAIGQCHSQYAMGYRSEDEIKLIEKIPSFTVTTTEAAKGTEERADREALATVMQELYLTDPYFHCKFNSVFSKKHKKPNVIRLATENDLQKKSLAIMEYFPQAKELSLRAGIAKRLRLFSDYKDSFKRVVIEEIHHAAQSSRNRELKQNYKQEFDNALALPHTTMDELAKLTNILKKGLNKARNLIQLYRSNPNHRDALKFKLLVKNYQPYVHEMSQASAKSFYSAWLQEGYIDRNFNLLKSFEWTLPVKLDNETSLSIRVINISANMISFHLVTHPLNKPLTALLDFYADVSSNLLKGQTKNEESIINQSAEIDAHAHRFYQQYPKIMEYLFPGLTQYHETRMGKEFEECVRRLRS